MTALIPRSFSIDSINVNLDDIDYQGCQVRNHGYQIDLFRNHGNHLVAMATKTINRIVLRPLIRPAHCERTQMLANSRKVLENQMNL